MAGDELVQAYIEPSYGHGNYCGRYYFVGIKQNAGDSA
jgi:hypothetical protein